MSCDCFRPSLLKGIDNIHYMGGGTNTADALNALRTQMFSQNMGARPGVPRIAVVITDGKSSSMANTVSYVPALLFLLFHKVLLLFLLYGQQL